MAPFLTCTQIEQMISVDCSIVVETHDGVQDMACDTFIKISHKCRRHFVVSQPGAAQAFIEEILHNLSSIICDLQPQQVHTFYEAVGMMIASQTDTVIEEKLIEKLFLLPNQVWDNIISQAALVFFLFAALPSFSLPPCWEF